MAVDPIPSATTAPGRSSLRVTVTAAIYVVPIYVVLGIVVASCVSTADEFVSPPVFTPTTEALPAELTSDRSSGSLESRFGPATTLPPGATSTPRTSGSQTLPPSTTTEPQIVGYYQDFRDGLGPEWQLYDSVGHAGWGLRRPSAISVENDPNASGGKVMVITAAMGSSEDEAGLLVSGGAKLRLPQTYGRYTFRVRVDGDPDEVTSGVVLLWPESNRWPADGELDIVETWASRASRSPVETNVHWADPAAVEPIERSDDRVLHHVSEGVSAAEWHIYQFEWRPDRLTLAIDAGPPALITVDPIKIPHKPMELTFQLDAFDAPYAPGQQPVLSAPVRMVVDYLLVEP